MFILFYFDDNVYSKDINYNIKGPFNKVIVTPCGSFTNNNFKLGIKYASNIKIQNNDVCNKKIKIKNKSNRKTVIVEIKDNYFNGKNGSLDLTTKAWNILSSKKDIHRGHMIVD